MSFMTFGAKRNAEITIMVGEGPIKDSKEQNLTLDQSSSFKSHVKTISRKPGQNLMLFTIYSATQTLKN